VRLTAGYWLGRFEVTRAQWQAVMPAAGRDVTESVDPETPISLVTWAEAVEFCEKLNAQERAAGRLPAEWAYALPTEAQWEYACRAGTTTPFHFGAQLGAALANINGEEPYGGAGADEMSDGPVPVGQYPPNDWGFHDMHGNVWEWTASVATARYPGGSVEDYANRAASGEHVLRGGSWRDAGANCRSAVRIGAGMNVSIDSYGFRLALTRAP
jgi:formylglycine-generating enzyme required for sulfatase activity